MLVTLHNLLILPFLWDVFYLKYAMWRINAVWELKGLNRAICTHYAGNVKDSLQALQ